MACMLNPHHVRVWELPFELVGVEGVQVDIRLRHMLISPLSAEYRESDPTGPHDGLQPERTGLCACSSWAAVWSSDWGRADCVSLTSPSGSGSRCLSLASVYAIPFFAAVSVPVIASQLNALSARVGLKSWGDPKTRFVLLGSASARVITLVAAAVICVLAWPGWVHPSSGDPAFARRVAWGIHRDGGYVRAAEQLEAWRKDGSLPAEARGLITTTELANYCAWFAPSEKVFMNAPIQPPPRRASAVSGIPQGPRPHQVGRCTQPETTGREPPQPRGRIRRGFGRFRRRRSRYATQRSRRAHVGRHANGGRHGISTVGR